jgi:hypothetical protein
MAEYNWAKPVSSLLAKFQRCGYDLFAVNDGGEYIIINKNLSRLDKRKEAVETITSVDLSSVYLISPKGRTFELMIVLGNEPSELVADYTYFEEETESIVEEFCQQWEGKKCPIVK